MLPLTFCVDRAEKTDDDVRALFEPYGKVELVNIPRNKATGDPRGFAFVDMASSEDLDAAIAGLDGASFGSRNIRVSKSVPKGEASDKQAPAAAFRKNEVVEGATKLYVGNIPFGTCATARVRGERWHGLNRRKTCHLITSSICFYSFLQRQRWTKSLLIIERTGRCWKRTFRWIAIRGRGVALRS